MATVGLVALWVAGMGVALFLPAFVVPPGQRTAPTGELLTAFGITVVGAVIMMVAAFGLWRHLREVSALVLGAVPAFACVAGGIVLVATKFTV